MPIMFHMEQPTLPTSLVAARERAKFSQEELAANVGVTRSAVSQWETGDTTPQGPARIVLSQVFNVPMAVVDSWFAKVEAVA